MTKNVKDYLDAAMRELPFEDGEVVTIEAFEKEALQRTRSHPMHKNVAEHLAYVLVFFAYDLVWNDDGRIIVFRPSAEYVYGEGYARIKSIKHREHHVKDRRIYNYVYPSKENPHFWQRVRIE